MGRISSRSSLTPMRPECDAKSSALPRLFENKVWSKNQSMEEVLTEYYMKIYNTKLKFTGLLKDAGNRRDS